MATANKTKATRASVADYLKARATTPEQRADCKALMAMFKQVTKQRPKMWGPSMVGYGAYRYTYASGRSGVTPLACFAIRGRDLVVYVVADTPGQKARLARLGKHSLGKVCLYFRRLADLDRAVLKEIVVESIEEFKRRHPGGDL